MKSGEHAPQGRGQDSPPGAERNRNYSVRFLYNDRYYNGAMLRATTGNDTFRLTLPADAALAFLRSFKTTGHVSLIVSPQDTRGFPSLVDIDWKTFPTDMKRHEDCEETKAHVTGYDSILP